MGDTTNSCGNFITIDWQVLLGKFNLSNTTIVWRIYSKYQVYISNLNYAVHYNIPTGSEVSQIRGRNFARSTDMKCSRIIIVDWSSHCHLHSCLLLPSSPINNEERRCKLLLVYGSCTSSTVGVEKVTKPQFFWSLVNFYLASDPK